MIQLIVPAQRGRLLDRMARAIQLIASDRGFVDTPWVVVNRPLGVTGDTTGGMEIALGDGSLLMLGDRAYAAMLIRRQPHWQRLRAVAGLASEKSLLWVHATAPARNALEWVQQARRGPAPLKVGGDGSGTQDDVLWRLIRDRADVLAEYIPYHGSGATSIQLAEQRIDAHVNAAGEEMENWLAGRTRPLCVLSDADQTYRLNLDGIGTTVCVPTASSQGIDVSYRSAFGVMAGPSSDESAIGRHAEAFARVTATDAWRAFLAEEHLDSAFMSAMQFAARLQHDFHWHGQFLSAKASAAAVS
jgi:putative tricarboxylic transport membrane protein